MMDLKLELEIVHLLLKRLVLLGRFDVKVSSVLGFLFEDKLGLDDPLDRVPTNSN